jgi:hypothetical protein
MITTPVPSPAPTTNTDFTSEAAYVKHLTGEINNTDVCGYLPTLMQEMVAKFETQLTSVMKETNVLSQLIIKPTDLGKLITWVSNFIENKLVGPYGKLISKYAELGVSYAQLATAIASKAGSLTCLLNPVVLVDFGGKLNEWAVTTIGGALLSQVTIGSIQAYRLSAIVPGDAASMTKLIPNIASRFNVNLGANLNSLSTIASGGMAMTFAGSAVKSIIHIDGNGILADNGGVLTRVYNGNMQAPGVMQNLKLSIDQSDPSNATMAGSLNGVPIFADANVSSALGSFTPSYMTEVSTADAQTTSVDVLHLTINNSDLDHELVTAVNRVGPNFGETKFAGPMMKW